MTPIINPDTLIIDANILVSICSKEALTHQVAEAELKNYAAQGWEFAAPHIVVAEVMFALCKKQTAGVLTQAEYEQAIESFINYMSVISTPMADSFLIKRADEIRKNYDCKRTSDGLYIALAEELSKTRNTEILTFDQGFTNQAANNAPSVKVKVLTV